MGQGAGGVAEEVRMADAPVVPPEEQLPAVPLLDGLMYKDEVEALFVKSQELLTKERERKQDSRWGKKPEPEKSSDAYMTRIPLTKYSALQEVKAAAQNQQSWFTLSSKPPTGPRVALVHAVGTIMQGPVIPGQSPPNMQTIDATKLSAALKKLADTPDVGAVVLRLSTPGGSALGSDLLHHALVRLRSAGKKLVISCGDLAASGGMFMAVAGDKIFAQPGTLTGSIGVITGKFHVSRLLEGYGVNPASIESGSHNLNLTSPFVKPSDRQVTVINHLMDAIYDDFLRKVSLGRHKSLEDIRTAAGGRVYTGNQALAVGLIDEHGGLREAIAEARKMVGIDPARTDEQVVFSYPAPKIPLIAKLLRAAGPAGGINPPDQDVPPPPPSQSELAFGEGSSAATWLGQLLLGRLASQGLLPAQDSLFSPASSRDPSQGGHLDLSMLAAALGAGGNQTHTKALEDLQGALSSVLAAAAALDGHVAAYSPEAHYMAATIR